MIFETETGLLGPARHDIHFGLLMSHIANMFGAKTVPKDFMPWCKETRQEPTQDELSMKIKNMFGK